jgi:AAA+ ATPase superfamily predicted ATPase
MDKFVDRAGELSQLQACYQSDDAELAVVYGRRQIGKSALVQQSIRDHDDAVYYQAIRGTPTTQRDRFVEAVAETYPGITDIKPEWEPLLSYLVDRDAIVILDEFPYLVDAMESFPSLIQHLWDTSTDDSSATVVLTGSAVGMIYTHVLDGGAPLYGRVSQSPNGRIELTELPFGHLTEFLPQYGPEELVFIAGVFGGTPRYLVPLDGRQSVGENVAQLLCNPAGPLHNEPETVLQMELTEVDTYFSILESMASGNRQRNEIAQGAGIQSTNTSYYFDRLETLGIVESHYPALVDPTRTKRTRYRIRDPVFRFYFRFLYGRSGRYQMYGDNAFEELIQPELPDFVSTTFEGLCQQAVPKLFSAQQFTQVPSQWWYGETEIDIIAPTDDETLLAGEVKFTSSPLGYDILAALEQDVTEVQWSPPDGGDPVYQYALFSRSGFTDSLRGAATERTDISLFTLADVVDALQQTTDG